MYLGEEQGYIYKCYFKWTNPYRVSRLSKRKVVGSNPHHSQGEFFSTYPVWVHSFGIALIYILEQNNWHFFCQWLHGANQWLEKLRMLMLHTKTFTFLFTKEPATGLSNDEEEKRQNPFPAHHLYEWHRNKSIINDISTWGWQCNQSFKSIFAILRNYLARHQCQATNNNRFRKLCLFSWFFTLIKTDFRPKMGTWISGMIWRNKPKNILKKQKAKKGEIKLPNNYIFLLIFTLAAMFSQP